MAQETAQCLLPPRGEVQILNIKVFEKDNDTSWGKVQIFKQKGILIRQRQLCSWIKTKLSNQFCIYIFLKSDNKHYEK